MAIQRDKNGKFSGSGTQSMENFVKMRENPGAAKAEMTKNTRGEPLSQPYKVKERNYNTGVNKGNDFVTGSNGLVPAIKQSHESDNKKKARADSKGTKLKESVGSQEVSRRSGLLGYKKVKK